MKLILFNNNNNNNRMLLGNNSDPQNVFMFMNACSNKPIYQGGMENVKPYMANTFESAYVSNSNNIPLSRIPDETFRMQQMQQMQQLQNQQQPIPVQKLQQLQQMQQQRNIRPAGLQNPGLRTLLQQQQFRPQMMQQGAQNRMQQPNMNQQQQPQNSGGSQFDNLRLDDLLQ